MPGPFSFARRKKTNRGRHLPSPRNHDPSSPTGRDQHPIRRDQRTILLRWKGLKNLGSIDHQQLAPLVDIEGNRDIALKFRGNDAAVVINTIDKALKQFEGLEETRLNALKVLRKLAGSTRQVPKRYLIGRWTRYTVKEEIIASGGFANVREGRLGNRVVAIKTLHTSKETNVNDIYKAFCKESVLWMNVSHPNVLKLIAVDIKPHDKKFSMISEMMTNGDITRYIRTRKANRLCLLKDVASGLEHLHRLGIIHGDLKGGNILINNEEPPQACISDFGLCAIAPWMSFNPTTHKDCVGTWGYMAPELYWGGGGHTMEADIYAFGIVVYEVVAGLHAYRRHRPVELPMLVTSGSRPSRPEDPVADGFGEGTWELIERCWEGDPQRRPTAGEVLEHFERVAATSKVVDPGSIPLARVADNEPSSGLDNSSRKFSKLLAQQPLSSSSRLQQAGFATRVFVDPGSVRAPVLIPPAVQDKRNLLDRVRRAIMTFKPLPASLRSDT